MKVKQRIIVVDEHTLAVEENTEYATILHSSILKGSTLDRLAGYISLFGANIRLATKKDFELYRVYFGAFANKNKYIYAE